MTDHARLSPSSAYQWMTCPGSVRLSDHFPERSSAAADEGTALHALREKALLEGKDIIEYVGEDITVGDTEYEVTYEWERWLQPGIDWLRDQPGELLVEKRVHLDRWMPDQFGTVDTILLNPGRITVCDFKGGIGLEVNPERNPQLMLYALGAWDAYSRDPGVEIELVVDQPRVSGITTWTTTVPELLEFAEEAAAAALRTEDPDAPLNPSIEACRFCRVAENAGCPALHSYCFDLLNINTPLTSELEMPRIDHMSPEQRSNVVLHAGMITKWLDSIKAFHLEEALKGNPTPGFKAVAKQGPRKWVNEKAAAALLEANMSKEEIYTQKLKSPAQLEKIAGTKLWRAAEELIERSEGKPALVPESDKCDAIIPMLNLLDDLD